MVWGVSVQLKMFSSVFAYYKGKRKVVVFYHFLLNVELLLWAQSQRDRRERITRLLSDTLENSLIELCRGRPRPLSQKGYLEKVSFSSGVNRAWMRSKLQQEGLCL